MSESDEKRASEQLEKVHDEKAEDTAQTARETVDEGETQGSDQAKLPSEGAGGGSTEGGGGEGTGGDGTTLAPGDGPSGGAVGGGDTGGGTIAGGDGPTGGAL